MSQGTNSWPEAQVERLIRLIEAGVSFHDIAVHLGCEESELEQEAFYLGISLPPHDAVRLSKRAFAPGLNRRIGFVQFTPRIRPDTLAA